MNFVAEQTKWYEKRKRNAEGKKLIIYKNVKRRNHLI